ncbi:MAG TPA: ABC transporter permease [Thermoanaerobaculia bacterium]|jgi:putative ABC transport system permease protein|nr:ABC transporter permease [Thermoanaerobaculia bacterium]
MSIRQDLTFSVRTLLRKPGFLATALITLSLSLGAATAVFSIVNTVLLRPLPFKAADRLIVLWNQKVLQDVPRLKISIPEFLDYQKSKAFEQLAAYYPWSYTMTGRQEPVRILGVATSASLFPALGVHAELGRTFTRDDDQPGKELVVVLSHGFWQRQFARDRSVLGRTLNLDGQIYKVIGVMSPDFDFPEPDVALWVPLAIDPADLPTRNARQLNVVGRLAPGVSVEQAQAEMNAFAATMQKDYPTIYRAENGWGILVIPLTEEIVGKVRSGLLLLFGAVVLVLLIACANVANLLLVRATARQREIAVRVALGSSRRRLIQQLLTESLVLSLLGGVLGLLLGLWATRLLVVLAAENIPRFHAVHLEPEVFAFGILLSVVTGLLFGLAPAFISARPDLTKSLKEGSRGSGMGVSRNRLRAALVISEVALTLVLLIGAGLMTKSFVRLQRVNPGFNAENVLVAELALPFQKYGKATDFQGFFDRYMSAVATLPGVQQVGAVAVPPFSTELTWSGDLAPEGEQDVASKSQGKVETFIATPGYAKAIGLTLLRGRFLLDQDVKQSPPVTVIDDVLAHRYWPNEDPIGKRLKSGGPGSKSPAIEVVGVVRHIKHESLEGESLPQVYIPLRQAPFRWPGRMGVAVRTASDPAALIAGMRAKLSEIDRDQPFASIDTMQRILSSSISRPRFLTWLLTSFALVALIVASVGLYGVLAYWVSQRRGEIGMRMALGAHRKDVLWLVLGQGMALTFAGLVVGALAAVWLTRAMKSLLFEVSTGDPLIFVGSVVLLTLISLFACQIPAWRAAQMDPGVTLRYE